MNNIENKIENVCNTLSSYARYLNTSIGTHISGHDGDEITVFETKDWIVWFKFTNNHMNVSFTSSEEPQLSFALMLTKALELRDAFNNAV